MCVIWIALLVGWGMISVLLLQIPKLNGIGCILSQHDFWEAWIDEKSNLGLENNTFVNMFFANKDTTYVNMCAGESTMRTDILVFLHVFFVDRLKYDVNVFAVFKKDVS